MKASHFLDSSDLEYADGYTLLPGNTRSDPDISPSGDRRPIKIFSAIFVSVLLFSTVVILLVNPKLGEYIIRKACLSTKNSNAENFGTLGSPKILEPSKRAVASEKKFRLSRAAAAYPWTTDMLYWQKPGFHFTRNNWMSDPDGPLFHMGWYHLFYQTNPESVFWGNITWGHAISTDLINWLHLPFAIKPDQWYDINGVWGGSATILPDGKIIMLYTGDTDNRVQVQNLAYPENASDPFLLKWVKYSNNPVMVPPPGIGSSDFRDPSTAWVGPDGKWRVTIGSKVNVTGLSLVYKTTDFISYELHDGVLHAVPATGMWECVDLYPVSVNDANGLDTSANGPGVKHVLKSSFDDDKNDYYAIGTYDPIKDKWVPDNPDMDVGLGLRMDYGNYYASKTFYDHDKKRRLLWGWISESDIRSETIDIRRGRASVQGIPRTVVFDKKTGSNVLQWPVKEVESLRLKSYEIDGVELKPGELVPIKISSATQLDIVATFEVDEKILEGTFEVDEVYSCTDGGGGGRGVLGPFGIVVLADDSLTEFTPVYFYIAKGDNGSAKSYFCADQTRSSAALDVGNVVYGNDVPVLHGEKYSMRLLVDHSMVESFAQGGRIVITSQVYPTRAIYKSARVFLFNNATGVSVKASVKAWEMASAKLNPFPFN